MNIGQRLKLIVKDKKITLKKFSQNTGVPYRTLQEYIANNSVPGGESLVKISTESRVSIDWLLTGQGAMYREEKPETGQSPKWLTNWWQKSDEAHKYWLEIQLTQTPPVTK